MQEKIHTYLALGDSYTIGESVDPALRWPVLWQKALVQAGMNIAPPTIIAKTGWTTDELQTALEKATLTPPYDRVSLLIGVNNQYRGRSPEEYRLEFRTLVAQAIQYAGQQPNHVLVLSIPDWGVTPFAAGRDRVKIALEIDAFNRINQEETQKAGAVYVDITAISREPKPEFIATDGLHPSGVMYAAWVEKIMNQLPLSSWK